MMLFGSSPDDLAKQQEFYDQYYLGANENNASRYDAAQARAIQNVLSQREADAQAQRLADSQAANTAATETANAFKASESQKARDAQFALYGSKGASQRFNELVRVLDLAPSDPKQLAVFTKDLAPQEAAQYKIMVQQRDAKQAKAQTAADAPQNEAASQGAALANVGNLYNQATADTAAIAQNPTPPPRSWYNPAKWAADLGIIPDTRVSPDNVIEPSDHANDLMASLGKSLAPQIAPAAIAAKDSTIKIDPVTGKLMPRYQPTATYKPPVIPPSNPPPVAPPIIPSRPIRPAPSPIVPNKTAAILPLPLLPTGKVDDSKLVAGQIYQTKRGPALWDGKQFSQ